MVNLSIKKLNVFMAVADCGSFSEGAKKTFITQPAAASIIDEIEAIVGQNLFSRNGKIRRAILTEKGQQAYDAFACAVRAYDDAIATLFSDSNQRRKQRILIQAPYVNIVSCDWLTHMLNNEDKINVVIEQGSWREIASVLEDRKTALPFWMVMSGSSAANSSLLGSRSWFWLYRAIIRILRLRSVRL